jgi:hypothetical protein
MSAHPGQPVVASISWAASAGGAPVGIDSQRPQPRAAGQDPPGQFGSPGMEPAQYEGRARQRVGVAPEGGLILNWAGGNDVPRARSVVCLPDGCEIARFQAVTTGVVGPWSIDKCELIEVNIASCQTAAEVREMQLEANCRFTDSSRSADEQDVAGQAVAGVAIGVGRTARIDGATAPRATRVKSRPVRAAFPD